MALRVFALVLLLLERLACSTAASAGGSLGSTNGAAGPKVAEVEGVRVYLSPPPKEDVSPTDWPSGFVRRSGHQLVEMGANGIDCPLAFLGFNAHWMTDTASQADWNRRDVVDVFAAAKRLGLQVGRTWAFNSRLPRLPGLYDEDQFQALDFVVYVAGRFGIRLVLALGNLWPAYFGPERWLYFGSSMQKRDTPGTILEFYGDPTTRALYRQHISKMASRVNLFTGIAYRDDPTIMAWNVLNEPRCPGCQSESDRGIVHNWMEEMTAHLRAEDPNHLISMGTEGFFWEDPVESLHQFNPGAGSQCEGEDWLEIANLTNVSFTTMHVYARQLEWQPVPPVGRSYLKDADWVFCDFDCYADWLLQWVQLHMELSEERTHKPMVIEEFGLTWWRSRAEDVKVVFEIMRQVLLHSARNSGPLAGIMFWSAGHNNSADQDGYLIKIDRWPEPLLDEQPPAISFPRQTPVLGSYKPFMTKWDYPPYTDTASRMQLVTAPSVSAATGKNSTSHVFKTSKEGVNTTDSTPASSTPASEGRPVPGRRLSVQLTELDSFRRGWQRSKCAEEAAKTWRPLPRNFSTVDVDSLRRYTDKLEITDLISQSAADFQAARSCKPAAD